MKVAKGCMYLPGCEVRLEESESRIWLRTAGAKVYYLHAEVEDQSSEAKAESMAFLKSWAKALNYAMEAARGFRDIKVAEGSWLHKRGGKSHGYVNWKKRRFMLRGNLLLYYSEDPELFDAFKYLKGFIDLASITSIDARENASDEVGRSFYFKIVVDNEREYFLSAGSLKQKDAWMKAIRKQTKLLADRLHYSNLRAIQKTEKIQASGELQRTSKSGFDLLKSYVVLTNVKLRYYDSQADFSMDSFGLHMVGSIPLLGCATQLKDEATEKDSDREKKAPGPSSSEPTSSTIVLHDLQGHTFEFTARSPKDAAQWVTAIRTASRALTTSVLAKDLPISLNTYAIGKKGEPLGYTIAQLDSRRLRIKWLLLDKEKELEWDEIDRVSLRKNNLFSLKYTRRRTSGKTKVIEFRSLNAIAFFDTISLVMTLQAEIEAKERKMAAKAAARAVDPAKVMKKTNSTMAMPLGAKMVQTRALSDSVPTSPKSDSPASPRGEPVSPQVTPGKLKAKSKSSVLASPSSTPPPGADAVASPKKTKKKPFAVPIEEDLSPSDDSKKNTPTTKRKKKEKFAVPIAEPDIIPVDQKLKIEPVRAPSPIGMKKSPSDSKTVAAVLERHPSNPPTSSKSFTSTASDEDSSMSADEVERPMVRRMIVPTRPEDDTSSESSTSVTPRTASPKKPAQVLNKNRNGSTDGKSSSSQPGSPSPSAEKKKTAKKSSKAPMERRS